MFLVPGIVQNLTVLQDPVTAQKISVTFDLPGEKDRNGSITQFVIRKTLLASPVSGVSVCCMSGDNYGMD